MTLQEFKKKLAAKRELKKKLAVQLAPLYEKIRCSDQVADVLVPADRDNYEQYLYFAYANDTLEDAHSMKTGKYISCYYVVEAEDGNYENDSYVEIGRNLLEVVNYLVDNYSMNRLRHLEIGCVDTVCAWG